MIADVLSLRDNANRLTSMVDAKARSQLLNLSYSRGSAGQLTAENNESYGYDGLNRLN